MYQEMYLTMMRETEKAIRLLVEAQRKCEELYISQCGESAPASFPCSKDRDPV